MRLTLHKCSVPTCGIQIPTDKLMCNLHWRRLPYPTRKMVHSAWGRYCAGVIGIEQLRAVQARATDALVKGVSA